MNIQNIIFYNTLSKKATVIGCALCLGMLALPMGAYAQDDETADEMENTIRKSIVTKKVYPTRAIKGRVLSATSGKPVSGALVSAFGIEGYSVLTDDDGTYALKVPVFVNSITVTNPTANSLTKGLVAEIGRAHV